MISFHEFFNVANNIWCLLLTKTRSSVVIQDAIFLFLDILLRVVACFTKFVIFVINSSAIASGV